MLRCLYSLLIGGTDDAGDAAISPESLAGDKRASKQLVGAHAVLIDCSPSNMLLSSVWFEQFWCNKMLFESAIRSVIS